MGRKRTHRNRKRSPVYTRLTQFSFLMFGAMSIAGFGVYHFVNAQNTTLSVAMELDPNIGLEKQVEEFFTDNEAPEMIPIIKCESNFRHYASDGSVLKNHEGSSAVGIAQILTSKHPDSKVLKVYNKQHNTDLHVSDLNIMTVEGNLGYALALYKVRGTRDWECAKKFRFAR